MPFGQHLDAPLTAMPPRARAAFAAACAEHVVDACTNCADAYDPAVATAIELAWRYAAGGAVSDAEVTAATERLMDLVQPYRADAGPAYNAILAGYHAARVAASHGVDDAKRAAYYALDAVNRTVDADGDPERAEGEEFAWQARALDVARAAGDQPIPKAGFAPIFADEPEWLKRLQS
jgi:hypothetical protein